MNTSTEPSLWATAPTLWLNSLLPVNRSRLHLRDVLGTSGKRRALEQIVVVRYRSGRVGLGVDAIRGERQTVIKPLGRLFRSVPGISGSTMRADGGVAFVIDVARLLRSSARPSSMGFASETTLVRGPAEI